MGATGVLQVIMYFRRRKRVYRKKRFTFRRRKGRIFKRAFYKRRRGKTVTRRRRRPKYAVRTIVCGVQIFDAKQHLSDCTKWSISDLPIVLRNIWYRMYEQVKFLKVSFKYWPLDICEEINYTNQGSTVQVLRSRNRTPELRYSYDPDNHRLSMDSNNIMKRRNAKHIVGARLNKPWYFSIRPTFTLGHDVQQFKLAVNPWFDTCDIFHVKTPLHPEQRNAYLWDYLSKFDTQRICCQRTITVGLRGVQNFSKYLPKENVWNTEDMISSLPDDDFDFSDNCRLCDGSVLDSLPMSDEVMWMAPKRSPVRPNKRLHSSGSQVLDRFWS